MHVNGLQRPPTIDPLIAALVAALLAAGVAPELANLIALILPLLARSFRGRRRGLFAQAAPA